MLFVLPTRHLQMQTGILKTLSTLKTRYPLSTFEVLGRFHVYIGKLQFVEQLVQQTEALQIEQFLKVRCLSICYEDSTIGALCNAFHKATFKVCFLIDYFDLISSTMLTHVQVVEGLCSLFSARNRGGVRTLFIL